MVIDSRHMDKKYKMPEKSCKHVIEMTIGTARGIRAKAWEDVYHRL